MAVFPADLTLEQLNGATLPALEKSFGLRYTRIEAETLWAEFTVGEAQLQPYGIMHGGVSCVIGEGLGSTAGVLALGEDRKTKTVVGQNLYALHLSPAKAGQTIEIEVTPERVGRRNHIWDIRLKDKVSKKGIARITLTLAVIEKA